MERNRFYHGESLIGRVARSKVGRMAASLMLLAGGLIPVENPIIESLAGYDPIELEAQDDIKLMTANAHNRPLTQFFNFDFLEQNPVELLNRYTPDIACFQEISEEDALNLRAFGDVVFTSNNEWPFNGSVGIALVSKRRIQDAFTPDLDSRNDQNRPAIVATIDGLRIACLHLTNSTILASSELKKINDLVQNLDVIIGDLNLSPKLVQMIMGDVNYASRTDKVTHAGTEGVIDRIILPDESRILVWKFRSIIIRINSDHRGVIAMILPSNWSNLSREDLK
jgi:endonuclease/exonuclease/phosphatase family metal-dependent hydrolase